MLNLTAVSSAMGTLVGHIAPSVVHCLDQVLESGAIANRLWNSAIELCFVDDNGRKLTKVSDVTRNRTSETWVSIQYQAYQTSAVHDRIGDCSFQIVGTKVKILQRRDVSNRRRQGTRKIVVVHLYAPNVRPLRHFFQVCSDFTSEVILSDVNHLKIQIIVQLHGNPASELVRTEVENRQAWTSCNRTGNLSPQLVSGDQQFRQRSQISKLARKPFG